MRVLRAIFGTSMLWFSVAAGQQPSRMPRGGGPGESPNFASISDYSREAALLPAAFTIRRTVPEVQMQFTVTDHRGRAVSDLQPEEVAVFDGGERIRRLESFRLAQDAPLQIGILFDVSTSSKRLFAAELAGTRQFLRESLGQNDVAYVAQFGARYSVVQHPTGDLASLERALGEPHVTPGATALFDSIVHNCRDTVSEFPTRPDARRALLLFTDGEDNDSMYSAADAANEALLAGVSLYAIALHAPWSSGNSDETLATIAERTGGELLFASGPSGVASALAAVRERLSRSYAISFRPAAITGGFRELRIAISRDDLVVRSRAGYFPSR